jgi:outer membrane receptor protein involved in Fe transport
MTLRRIEPNAATRSASARLRTLVVCLLAALPLSAAHALAQGARISGVVLDQTGTPVAGAAVVLRHAAQTSASTTTNDAQMTTDAKPRAGTKTIAQTTTTDAAGRFSFEQVEARAGFLVVSARGFAETARAWRADETDAAPLRIELAPAPLAEQVTVTAARVETRLGETATSVAVLARAELATTAAVTLDDALRQVAGFQLFRRAGSRTANPTTQGVSLRGVGASGASRAVVLADGVPLNDPFGGWVYWGRVPRESIQAVEVLRGGASALYGGGALGGVVNVVTRRPSTNALALELSYGNQRTPDAALYASGARGRWTAGLSAELFSTGGYVLVAERERGRVDTRVGARHSTVELTLARSFSDDTRVFMRGALFGEARMNGTPLQTNRTHVRQLSAGGDFSAPRAGAFNLRAYMGAQVFDQNFSAVAATRATETLTRVQRVPAQVFGASAQWSRALGARQTFVAGFDWREVRGASDEIVYNAGQATSLVGAGGRERTAGFFVEDIVRVGSRLFVTAGVRADRWRNYAATNVTRPLRPNGAPTVNAFPDRVETAFSPRLSALYRVSARLSLTAAGYRAFRQPTLNELYRTFRVGDALTLANEHLRAERLTGGEAGARLNAFDERLTVRGAFYWTEVTRPVANVTLSVTPSLITRQRQNLGRTRARGLELETEARIGDRWTVTGGYLLADSSVTRFPANVALEGLRVPQIARQQLTLQARYVEPAGLTFGVQARASGAQFDDDQNRLRLAPYFTLDALAARAITRRVSIFAAAENLFNQRYETGRTPVLTLGPPLLVRAGLRLQLGAH